jgi:hypothetical protein
MKSLARVSAKAVAAYFARITTFYVWVFIPLRGEHMGRVRIPTAIQDAKGAYITHKNRRHEEPTFNKPLGGPSKYLNAFQVLLWKEIKRDLLPGVAKKSDRHAFESMVLLKERERSGAITAAERGQLIALFAHFGLTPASRSKVAVPEKPKSSLNDFLNKKKQVPIPEPSSSVDKLPPITPSDLPN